MTDHNSIESATTEHQQREENTTTTQCSESITTEEQTMPISLVESSVKFASEKIIPDETIQEVRTVEKTDGLHHRQSHHIDNKQASKESLDEVRSEESTGSEDSSDERHHVSESPLVEQTNDASSKKTSIHLNEERKSRRMRGMKSLAIVVLIPLIVAFICYKPVQKLIEEGKTDFQSFVERSVALGFHVEEHFVQTSDGFILSVHRVSTAPCAISSSSCKASPILMGHGLGGSSDTFIRNTADTSLAYFLANQGYDVFMMNSRGNEYSQGHSNYTRSDVMYWDFSFEEMAKYDLPAVAAYIHDTVYERSSKLLYIGHSQGCTLVLAALADGTVSSEFFEKIILLTPASIQKHVDAPIQNFIKQYDFLPFLRDTLGMNEFLRMNLLNYLACKAVKSICSTSLLLVTDEVDSPVDHEHFYKLMLHYPAGTSTKSYIHFNQINQAKKFQHFDYGKKENLKRYDQITPPEFDLSRITNQVHIIAGDKDLATPIADVYHLQEALINSKNVTMKVYNEGHCSFIFGTDNKYQKYLLELLGTN